MIVINYICFFIILHAIKRIAKGKPSVPYEE